MINIVVTSKPVDGLLHYSYEYCCQLNSNGVPARIVIIPRGKYQHKDYIKSLYEKYIYVENVVNDDYWPEPDDVSMTLGRSMVSIPYKEQTPWYTNSQMYQPYVNVDKKFVAGVYKDHKLMDTLYPFTSSCVGSERDTEYFTKGCDKCFWCNEKKWAFET